VNVHALQPRARNGTRQDKTRDETHKGKDKGKDKDKGTTGKDEDKIN
jgi:hypothetical protein